MAALAFVMLKREFKAFTSVRCRATSTAGQNALVSIPANRTGIALMGGSLLSTAADSILASYWHLLHLACMLLHGKFCPLLLLLLLLLPFNKWWSAQSHRHPLTSHFGVFCSIIFPCIHFDKRLPGAHSLFLSASFMNRSWRQELCMLWQALWHASTPTCVHPLMGSHQSVPEGPTELLISSSPPICFSGERYCFSQPDTLFLKKEYEHSGIKRPFGHWKILVQDPNGITVFQITMESEEGMFGHRLVYIRDINSQAILNLKLPRGLESGIQIRKEGEEDVDGAVLVRKPMFARHPDVKAYLPGSHKAGKAGEEPNFRASANKWGFMVYAEEKEEKTPIAQLAYGRDSGVMWLADGVDVALMLAIAAAADCMNDGGLLYRETNSSGATAVVAV